MWMLLCECAALAAPLKLRYFDARGAAELTRTLLHYGDMEFEDERWTIDFDKGFKSIGFEAAKISGELASNLNRAPVLMVGDTVLGQSRAIERYVARECGLLGNDSQTCALIDAITEHVRDVRDAQRMKGFSPFTRDKTDEQKAAAKKDWFEVDLPAWLAKLEAVVGDAGFAVAGERSYADFVIWGTFVDSVRDDPPVLPPKLAAICQSVEAEPKVAAWVAKRPVTRL